ncbi:MAG: hypothetical protein R2730_08835 [Chitinophagales bacterium]
MKINWLDYKVGYVPLTPFMKGPGDRRRFVNYANNRNVSFELADPNKFYDIVYLTYNCVLSDWIKYKQKYGDKTKIIFELVDSYFAEDVTYKSRLRGIANYILRRTKKLYLDHRKALIELVSVADAIVCSTLEQKTYILNYNDNVHVSLDIFEDDISTTKEEYAASKKLKLVWEGQPYTIGNILSLKSVLNELKDKIELHIVTDKYYYKYYKKYFRKETSNILKELKCDYFLHEWKINTFSKKICDADLAIIPINMEDNLAKGKPENKLILFWKMGIPTITSATPAYERVMRRSDLNMACSDINDWKFKLNDYINLSSIERKAIAEKASAYAYEVYSREQIYEDWDKLFSSVISISS